MQQQRRLRLQIVDSRRPVRCMNRMRSFRVGAAWKQGRWVGPAAKLTAAVVGDSGRFSVKRAGADRGRRGTARPGVAVAVFPLSAVVIAPAAMAMAVVGGAAIVYDTHQAVTDDERCGIEPAHAADADNPNRRSSPG